MSNDNQDASRWRRLAWASLVSLAVHLVAGVAMAVILRHGLESNDDSAGRMRFLAESRLLWTLAWLTWHAAALAILWFFFSFVEAHAAEGPSRGLLHVALLLVAAAIVPDLVAQSIEIGVLPDLASEVMHGNPAMESQTTAVIERLFHALHRTVVMLTGYLANGLYTLATIAAVAATWKFYAAWTRLAGMAVGLFGFWLSAAALINSVAGMVWSNVGLVPAIALWQIGIALDARSRAAGK
jgi:hypothetical protein